MPLTFTPDDRQLIGTKRSVRGTVTFDSSYVTGGEPFTAADLGLTYLTDFVAEPSSTGYVPIWDRSVAAPKLLAYQGAAGALTQVANATNLATTICRFEATGY